MEYLRGETLGHRLRRQPCAPAPPQVLHTLWQVASALVAAHSADIVHRDLKPENIMLVADPIAPTGERAKLLDFRNRAFSLPRHPAARDHHGRVLGTPTYMSPEQCRGVGAVGRRAMCTLWGDALSAGRWASALCIGRYWRVD